MCANFGREPHGKGLAKPRSGETRFEKALRLMRRRIAKEKAGKYGRPKTTTADTPLSSTQRLAMLSARP